MNKIEIAVLAAVAIIALRHRSTPRAMKKAANRQVWSQAQDTRHPRMPGHRHGRRRGIK